MAQVKKNSNSGVIHFALLGVIALVGILAFSVSSFQNYSGAVRSSAQEVTASTTFSVQSNSDIGNADGSTYSQPTSVNQSVWVGTGNNSSLSILGMRLRGGSVPQGANIESARVEMQAANSSSVALNFKAFLETSGTMNLGSMKLSSFSQSFTQTDSWSTNQVVSYDVTSLLSQFGTSSARDNYTLVFQGTDSSLARRNVWGSTQSGKQPKLIVEYSTISAPTMTAKPSSTPIPTATSANTPRGVPTPPATASPTSSPIPTTTPVSGSAPSGGLGIGGGDGLEIGINLAKFNQLKADAARGVYDRPCSAAEHDKTKWHTLVNTEAKCHYDHQHFDDPHYVNDIFGEPGAWFGRPGQSVSYPWQTFAATRADEPNNAFVAANKMENDVKHDGYSWIVRRDQPCPNGDCVRDFRIQLHFHGSMDVPVRFHSYSFEGRFCKDGNDLSTCGIVRYGGWMDYGPLVTSKAPNDLFCGNANRSFVPLPADSLFFPIERPEARDEVRCHPMLTVLPKYPSSRALAEWWGHGPGETRVQIKVYDPMSNINPANPSEFVPFCKASDATCQYNQSIMTAFMGYTMSFGEFFGGKRLDATRDGRTDFSGYATRWGRPASCTQAGLDCIPRIYDNVVNNFFDGKEGRYNHAICDNCSKLDYDISPPGKQWITWFYKYVGM